MLNYLSVCPLLLLLNIVRLQEKLAVAAAAAAEQSEIADKKKKPRNLNILSIAFFS